MRFHWTFWKFLAFLGWAGPVGHHYPITRAHALVCTYTYGSGRHVYFLIQYYQSSTELNYLFICLYILFSSFFLSLNSIVLMYFCVTSRLHFLQSGRRPSTLVLSMLKLDSSNSILHLLHSFILYVFSLCKDTK